ncbi:alpha/beta fold hydrolase [Gallaecimonas sp. GXIMD4217]|uniref:dienelactone hydrolase family protein n=1 Tax=Gallaecimonas sp. GXIMD4217 TaxID=3131927 RepID=UPI00311B3CC1
MADIPIDAQAVQIELPDARLEGNLNLPATASGLVVFVHGSGSSRFSPRNRQVARALNDRGLATLLFDLLTEQESVIDERTRVLRFDMALIGNRMVKVVNWLMAQPTLASFSIGLFGASTGAAAALIAAAAHPDAVKAVVSRGGRPDLAGGALAKVQAPTLLIVGGLDAPVIQLNEEAARQMTAELDLEIVPGASHLFEEPGTLEVVCEQAADWFLKHL